MLIILEFNDIVRLFESQLWNIPTKYKCRSVLSHKCLAGCLQRWQRNQGTGKQEIRISSTYFSHISDILMIQHFGDGLLFNVPTSLCGTWHYVDAFYISWESNVCTQNISCMQICSYIFHTSKVTSYYQELQEHKHVMYLIRNEDEGIC